MHSERPLQRPRCEPRPSEQPRVQPSCLTRDFSPYFAERYSRANNTQFCMSHEDYGSFFRGVVAKRDYEAYGLHVYMVVDIVQSGV